MWDDIIGTLSAPLRHVARFQFPFLRHVKVNVFVQHIYGVSSVHKAYYLGMPHACEAKRRKF
jgi:hypothetical protein